MFTDDFGVFLRMMKNSHRNNFICTIGSFGDPGFLWFSGDVLIFGYGSKLGTPKLWMVNTKLD